MTRCNSQRKVRILALLLAGVTSVGMLLDAARAKAAQEPVHWSLQEGEQRLISLRAESALDAGDERARIEQAVDWLFLAVLGQTSLGEPALRDLLLATPVVRRGYLRETTRFEYGQTRARALSEETVVALIPATPRIGERFDWLARILDEKRKNLGTIPRRLVVFEYRIADTGSVAWLRRAPDEEVSRYYARQEGYFERAVQSPRDLNNFFGATHDLTLVRYTPGQPLVLGGRTLHGRQPAGLGPAEVATIWDAQRQITRDAEAARTRIEQTTSALEREFERAQADFNAESHRLGRELVNEVEGVFEVRWEARTRALEEVDSVVTELLNHAISAGRTPQEEVVSLTTDLRLLSNRSLLSELGALRTFRHSGSPTTSVGSFVALWPARKGVAEAVENLVAERDADFQAEQAQAKSEFAALQARREREFQELVAEFKSRVREKAADLAVVQDNEHPVAALGFSLDPVYRTADFARFFHATIRPQLESLQQQGHLELPPDALDEFERALDGAERDVGPVYVFIEQLSAQGQTLTTRAAEELLRRLVTRDTSADDTTQWFDRATEAFEQIERITEQMEQALVFDHGYQRARYDGPIAGTEVGMILFYTDLLAKLWALDFTGTAPHGRVPGFSSMVGVKLAPIFLEEIRELSNTRVWFGLRPEGYEVVEGSGGQRTVYFARNVTRIYAASANPAAPGKEGTPNAQSEAFLGWWDDHYEEVAIFEPQYERLNQVFKWAFVAAWLSGEDATNRLGFLQDTVPPASQRTLWFPEWARAREQQLRFTRWDALGFHPRKPGQNRESLPLLRSVTFNPFPHADYETYLGGGVSLPDRQVITSRGPVDRSVAPSLRSAAIDYRKSNQRLLQERSREVRHERIDGPQGAVVRSSPDASARFRAGHSQLASGVRESTVVRNSETGTITRLTRHGETQVAKVSARNVGSSILVEAWARDLEIASDLARRLSIEPRPVQVLGADARITALMYTPEGWMARLYGVDAPWVRFHLIPDSVDVPPGLVARVADPLQSVESIGVEYLSAADIVEAHVRGGEYYAVHAVPGPSGAIAYKRVEVVDEVPAEADVKLHLEPFAGSGAPPRKPPVEGPPSAPDEGSRAEVLVRLVGDDGRERSDVRDVKAQASTETIYYRRDALPETIRDDPEAVVRLIAPEEAAPLRERIRVARESGGDKRVQLAIPEIRLLDRQLIRNKLQRLTIDSSIGQPELRHSAEFGQIRQLAQELELDAQRLARQKHVLMAREIRSQINPFLAPGAATRAWQELVALLAKFDSVLLPAPTEADRTVSALDWLASLVSDEQLEGTVRTNAAAAVRYVTWALAWRGGEDRAAQLEARAEGAALRLDYHLPAERLTKRSLASSSDAPGIVYRDVRQAEGDHNRYVVDAPHLRALYPDRLLTSDGTVYIREGHATTPSPNGPIHLITPVAMSATQP